MANEFIIKHGFHSKGNSAITGSLNISGSFDINMPTGSVFTIHEGDIDQTNRLTFEYGQGDPTLIVASRNGTSKLHLKQDLAGNGLQILNTGLFIRTVSAVNYGVQLGAEFKPNTTNQLDLGFWNRRWKNLYLYANNKISWGTINNTDLVSLRNINTTNTLQVTGSSDVTLDVKGAVSASKFTAISGSSGLPAYTFHHQGTTGMYSQGNGYLQFQVAAGGSPEVEITTGQITFRKYLNMNNNYIQNISRLRYLGEITGSSSGNNLGISASLDLVGDLSISKTTGGPDPGDGSTISYAVTVVSSGGDKFAIDLGSGAQTTPDFSLLAGNTYRFTQDDTSNSGHEINFVNFADESSVSGVTYNGTAGQAGSYAQIVVTNSTPKLKYVCVSHGSGMGDGAAVTITTGSLNTMAGSAEITGSLNVTGSTNIIGSLTATTISGDGSGLTNIIPNNTVSSSAQVKAFLPSGTISSSLQVSASAAASGFGSGGGGTTVVANPGSSGGGALSTIGIGGTNFSVSSGGSGIFSDSNGFKLTNNNLIISKSAAGALTSSLSVQGSGSSIFEVKGKAGQLFDVQDGLDGVLMSVNDISGIPILTVSSSGDVTLAAGSNLLGTASVALNVPGATSAFPFTGNALITGELDITGSGNDIFKVRSKSGSLFSVDDGLDGILMSVNDISGLPLFEISSSGDIQIVEGNISGSSATASFGHLIVNGTTISGGSGTSVVANPGSSGAGSLTTIGIGGLNYSVSGGGSSIDTGSLGNTVITGSLTVSSSIVDFSSASSVLLPDTTIPLINPQVEYLTTTAITSSGDTVPLPNGLTFISSSTFEYLEVFINGLRLRYDIDFAPRSTSTVKYFTTLPIGTEVTYKSLRR